jgi:hypothetical protein
MIIGIILVVIGIIVVAAAVTDEKEKMGGRVFAALCSTVIIIVGTGFITAELTEGLPKDTYSISNNCMPPENSPLIIKMISVENNYCYMTTAPYNNVDSMRQYYYQIPIEKIEDLNSIEVGATIINDNGVLKPFKNN